MIKKICLLLMIILGLIGCGSEEAKVDDGSPVIRMVMKNFTPSSPQAVRIKDKIQADMRAEGTDITIELTEIPQGSYGQKLNFMIMSGNVPDIMYFQSGDVKMAEQGLLEDLTPYIEKSEIIQGAMEPYQKKRVENYPYLLWINPIRKKMLTVRKSWFEEYGKTPVTVDDFYDMFEYFHKEKGVYAVSATGDTERLDDIFNFAFGIKSQWMKDTNGKYVYSRTTEFEKTKLEFYRKLYKNGLLDPEYITTKWNELEDKFYNQTTAGIIGSSGRVLDIYRKKMREREPNEDLVVFDPPKGIYEGFAPINVIKEDRGMSISALSENKELAFKVLEYLASEKGQMLEQFGFEGDQYNVVDGKIVFTDKIESWYPAFFEVTAKEMPVTSLGKIGIESKEIGDSYYNEDINFTVPQEYITRWDAMDNLYLEYAFKIISGEYSIDKFDEFTKKWYNAGGKEVTEYANEHLEN